MDLVEMKIAESICSSLASKPASIPSGTQFSGSEGDQSRKDDARKGPG
jgi:hypothetical protein